MAQDNSDYEQKIAQANAARQRQLEKQNAKQASPEYQKEQQEKQQAAQLKSREKSYQKMKDRMADPEYIKEQQEKQRETQSKAFEKQRARQQVKEASPEYKVKKKPINKKISSIKIRNIKTSEIKLTQTKPIKSNSIKSRGTKGRNPTALEKILGNKIGDIGCICCLNKKWYTTDMAEQETTKFVSLHHVDGRTKEWSHAKVLPLCAYHHDTPAPSHAPEELTPIHRGNKKEWISFNGTEDELLKQVYDIIEEERPWLGGGSL